MLLTSECIFLVGTLMVDVYWNFLNNKIANLCNGNGRKLSSCCNDLSQTNARTYYSGCTAWEKWKQPNRNDEEKKNTHTQIEWERHRMNEQRSDSLNSPLKKHKTTNTRRTLCNTHTFTYTLLTKWLQRLWVLLSISSWIKKAQCKTKSHCNDSIIMQGNAQCNAMTKWINGNQHSFHLNSLMKRNLDNLLYDYLIWKCHIMPCQYSMSGCKILKISQFIRFGQRF